MDSETKDRVNLMTNISQQITFLLSVVNSSAVHDSTNASLRKATAIRYLGLVGGTNSIVINTLISNLNFINIMVFQPPEGTIREQPAIMALARIGEPSVPALLNFIETTTNIPGELPYAVEALMRMKYPKYHDFLIEQKNKMPPDRWKLMSKYSVN